MTRTTLSVGGIPEGVIRVGDTVTAQMMIKNPDRRWWQFWKPKFVSDLRTFTVSDVVCSTVDLGGDPVEYRNDRHEWGFWDETWSTWHGGFQTEEAARKGLEHYVEHYL